MKKDARVVQELGSAFIGSAIGVGLRWLLMDHNESMPWPELVKAVAPNAISGAILGWVYRLATTMRKVTDDALTRLELATRALDIQEKPLQMLISTRHHPETLGLLLSDSMREKYRFISYVDENKYLTYLMAAIAESKCYHGVQRFPVRWFRSEGRDKYLHALRDHRMKVKVRVFITDDVHTPEMIEDLANIELMNFYWSNTGNDVRTYWTTTAALTDFYKGIAIPGDFALYDKELLVEYDASTRTLLFDIIKADDNRHFIFESISVQEQHLAGKPFKKIEDPHSKR